MTKDRTQKLFLGVLVPLMMVMLPHLAKAQSVTIDESCSVDLLPATCKPERISAAGRKAIFLAKSSAKNNWQREVRNKYGEIFLEIKNAACKRMNCTASSVGLAGVLFNRCTFSAFPCSKYPVEDEGIGAEMNERRIKEIQTLLFEIGYNVEVTGIEDRNTRRAIRRWQRAHNKPVTGKATRKLLRELRLSLSDPENYNIVRRTQRLLIKLGYSLQADGMLGPKTRRVIRRWQRSRGYKVTGVPTEATLRRLLNEVLS